MAEKKYEPKPTALVVDDEKLTREGIAETLGTWGCPEVFTAGNGRDALYCIKEHGESQIGLLITDMRMPIMDGPELLDELSKRNIDIPAIVLSAYADFQYAQKAIHYGVFEYILKPIDPEQLLRALDKRFSGDIAKSKPVDLPEILQTSDFLDRSQEVWHPGIKAATELLLRDFRRVPGAREVADGVGLNTSYFCSLFKTQTGYTFGDFLMEVRMWHAKKLLVTTDLKVYEIADAIGYTTARYFAKAFHDKTGMTPLEFRTHYRSRRPPV